MTSTYEPSIKGRKVYILWWYGAYDISINVALFQDKEDADVKHDALVKTGAFTTIGLREEKIG